MTRLVFKLAILESLFLDTDREDSYWIGISGSESSDKFQQSRSKSELNYTLWCNSLSTKRKANKKCVFLRAKNSR